jgi:hypothetical protein
MRIVTDSEGDNWICLEVPPKGGEPDGQRRMECNSGAARVEIFVPENWEDLADGEFLGRIARALAAR